MKTITYAILALISTKVYSAPNQTEKSFIIEASTMGIRLGYDFQNWRVCARVNGDYSASESNRLDKEKDSITYDYKSGLGFQSNIEFGLGLDKAWGFDKSELGTRIELSYIYPFTNTDNYLRYNNIQIATYRMALLANHSIGPVSVGTSIGPLITWNYRHYIYEFVNNKGNLVSYNQHHEKYDASIKSELFIRYEFK